MLPYIWQMLWPARLAVFYPHPNDRLPLVELAAIAFLVGISLLVIYLRRTKPYLVTGWFWYLGMLGSSDWLFVQVGEQAHADRYTHCRRSAFTS